MAAISLNYKTYPYIALVIGYYAGSYLGAISAFLFVREYFQTNSKEVGYELALLKICSLLIKSDGNVDNNEIVFVKSFFNKTFGVSKSNKLFKQLKELDVPSSTSSLVEIIKKKLSPVKYYTMIQFLYALASSDGKITRGEDDFILNIGAQFGFDPERLNQIRNQFVKKETKSKKYDSVTVEHLSVLGLKPGVSSDVIKKAYRDLVKEYHPDKLSGMSDGIKNLAKEKFQEIQNSYEFLIKNYV
tara:strand:- start:2616 stop:3347 length:732 start_codon:yes stop_codon:yes gene_type:complete